MGMDCQGEREPHGQRNWSLFLEMRGTFQAGDRGEQGHFLASVCTEHGICVNKAGNSQ